LNSAKLPPTRLRAHGSSQSHKWARTESNGLAFAPRLRRESPSEDEPRALGFTNRHKAWVEAVLFSVWTQTRTRAGARNEAKTGELRRGSEPRSAQV